LSSFSKAEERTDVMGYYYIVMNLDKKEFVQDGYKAPAPLIYLDAPMLAHLLTDRWKGDRVGIFGEGDGTYDRHEDEPGWVDITEVAKTAADVAGYTYDEKVRYSPCDSPICPHHGGAVLGREWREAERRRAYEQAKASTPIYEEGDVVTADYSASHRVIFTVTAIKAHHGGAGAHRYWGVDERGESHGAYQDQITAFEKRRQS
jgi:hypothetical protein